MTAAISTWTPEDTVAALLHQLGDVPPERVLLKPFPGTATPDDVLRLADGEPKRLCELIDGILVEKAIGHRESRIAMWLGHLLAVYLEKHNLGVVAGADGPHTLEEGHIRFPDIAFISWDRIPVDADPTAPMPDWIPNLAVEVIGQSNSPREMRRKLKDYQDAGVELVWYIDPAQRQVRVFSASSEETVLGDADELTGGTVLPGFTVSVRELLNKGNLQRPE